MTPAFAVIAEMRERGYTDFIWVGHKYNQYKNKETSPEYQTVRKLSIPFIDLRAGKLNRTWGNDWFAGLINLIKIPWGFIHSFWIILRYKPNVIMSFGGYLALPIVIVGKLLGKKVLTHEQTAVTGLTNKIIPKFADRILVSWPSSQQYYPPEKTILTGNPLRPEIFEVESDTFVFDNHLPIVYITGGNQGSHKVNKAVFEQLPEILQICNIIHQTGNSSITKDAETANSMKLSLPLEIQSRYIPKTFVFENEIGEAFSKANLVVARSGANTTYEILALGKMTIFVPIPWVTHNEQFLNAQIASEVGLATILEENRLNGINLLRTLELALELQSNQKGFNDKNLSEVQVDAKNIVKFNAADAIVDEIEGVLKLHT